MPDAKDIKAINNKSNKSNPLLTSLDKPSLLLVSTRSSRVLLSTSRDNPTIELLPFINLHLIWNKGIAFGLFSFSENSNYNLLTILILFIILVVFWMVIKTKGLEKYCFLMVFGGSIGNVYDRLFYSSVPDFIDIYYKNFHWFIFNVADIFITLGVIVLILNEFVLKNK